MAVPSNPFTLAEWRRTVAEMYAEVRRTGPVDQPRAWEMFRESRDKLFRNHAQTPLSPEQLANFTGLPYYPYRPAWRLAGRLDQDVPGETFEVELGGDGLVRYSRAARVHFMVGSRPAELTLFWIEGYGGGLFLPFQDSTNGQETFGGGRYLYDTIKGADLGVEGAEIVLDFNYAFNPSCAYHDHWLCPLAPPENRLPFAVEAGEKVFRP